MPLSDALNANWRMWNL